MRDRIVAAGCAALSSLLLASPGSAHGDIVISHSKAALSAVPELSFAVLALTVAAMLAALPWRAKL